jgi:cellulose synthase/poly-beta-1,6-N-acetylglucosamine synthase-like glycosyltransferase
MLFFDVLLLLSALLLAVPCLVLLTECLAAPVRIAESPLASARPRPSVVVLVPAYNEQLGITATVSALRGQLAPGDRLLVVADNCTDQTAELATAAGATVVARQEAERQGKGYALSFGAAALAAEPPDVVVVVDADCRVADGGIERLARRASESGRPVQAEYLLRPPEKPDARTALSGMALVVKNQVRPRGLSRLGLPCLLTGSGMAFPWPLLRDATALQGNLVEDMVLAIDLALRGTPPLPCPSVSVSSELPEGERAQQRQRRRWEHGHLSVVRSHVPRLLRAGLTRPALLAMALDLLVPPLALLVLLLGAVGALGLVLWWLGGWVLPFAVALTGATAVTLAAAIAWLRFGRAILPVATFLLVPRYVVWKLPLYASYFLRRGSGRWERTTRPGEPDPP